MKNIKSFAFLIVLQFFIQGCEKGDTGPAGPPGQNGNANVTSFTYEAHTSTILVSTDGVTTVQVTLSVPAITNEIINTGTVLVYTGGSLNSTYWYALPLSLPFDQSNVIANFTYSYSQSVVYINTTLSDGSNPGSLFLSYYKVVIIAGTGKIKNPNVNWSDYNEIKSIYDLKD